MAPMIFSIVYGVMVLGLLVFGLRRGSAGMKLFCLIILLLIVFFAASVPWHPSGGAREQAWRVHCMNNLRQIAMATLVFQEEHTNQLPESLRDLTNTLSNPKGYVCRSRGVEPGPFVRVNEWTDYVFVCPPGSNQVLVYCPPENHKAKGGNIAFLDGSVQWCNPQEFTNVLKYGRQEPPQ